MHPIRHAPGRIVMIGVALIIKSEPRETPGDTAVEMWEFELMRYTL